MAKVPKLEDALRRAEGLSERLEAAEAERDAANARIATLRETLDRRAQEHELTVRERDDAIEARNNRISALQRELEKLRPSAQQLEDRRVLMNAMEAKHVHALVEKNDEIGSLERRIQTLENRLRAAESESPRGRQARTPRLGTQRQKPPSKPPRT